jgi:hypothetical protein
MGYSSHVGHVQGASAEAVLDLFDALMDSYGYERGQRRAAPRRAPYAVLRELAKSQSWVLVSPARDGWVTVLTPGGAAMDEISERLGLRTLAVYACSSTDFLSIEVFERGEPRGALEIGETDDGGSEEEEDEGEDDEDLDDRPRRTPFRGESALEPLLVPGKTRADIDATLGAMKGCHDDLMESIGALVGIRGRYGFIDNWDFLDWSGFTLVVYDKKPWRPPTEEESAARLAKLAATPVSEVAPPPPAPDADAVRAMLDAQYGPPPRGPLARLHAFVVRAAESNLDRVPPERRAQVRKNRITLYYVAPIVWLLLVIAWLVTSALGL